MAEEASDAMLEGNGQTPERMNDSGEREERKERKQNNTI